MTVENEFERLLKRSPHFADILNTHREAVGEILGEFVGHLVSTNQISATDALAILKRLDLNSGRPSIDSSRRLLVAAIRESLKRTK